MKLLIHSQTWQFHSTLCRACDYLPMLGLKFIHFDKGAPVCGQRLDKLRPRQKGLHFAEDILNFIFLNENGYILFKIQSTIHQF